jgi:hypothetical protein
MSTYPYLSPWLQCLSKLAPPRGLIHVGAGGGAAPYPFADVPRLLVVDADAQQCALLQTQLEGHGDCQVISTVVTDQIGAADFFTLSQSLESGLCPSDTLQALWPNIKALHTEALPSTSLQALLSQAPNEPTGYNWAVIDCLPANAVIEGAGTLIAGWDVVLVRAFKSAPWDASLSVQAMCLPAIQQQLASHGLEFVSFEEENHPQMVRALFVRNPSHQFAKEKERLTAALEAEMQISKERNAALLALQTLHDSLILEKLNLITTIEEQTSAKEQLVIQLDAEISAKNETLVECRTLAQKSAETYAQRFQLTQDNEKLLADNAALVTARDHHAKLVAESQATAAQMQVRLDELAQERDQCGLQRDNEAKAEAMAQRDQVTADNATLVAARDHQAKLAADLQAAVTQMQARLDELTQERDQCGLQRNSEVQARAEATTQRDQFAADNAALGAARDHQAKLAAELQATVTQMQVQLDELAQERDQCVLQRDSAVKARADVTAERDQVAADNAALVAARGHQAKLEAELQATVTQMQVRLDELTQERDQCGLQRDSEFQARTEVTVQRDKFAADNDAQVAATDHQTMLAAELQATLTHMKAQLEALAQERSTLIVARDELAKERDRIAIHLDEEVNAKTEALAHLAQTAQEKAALFATLDEQTVLIAERQTALVAQQRDLASKQQRLQQLETENQEQAVRQQMLQEELIKAEAQIELIKDLLLREPGF